jgi:AcrR family transcriptional regulator
MNGDDFDSKHKILQTAKMLFSKQGYDATSIRQICEAAGVNTALISYHFGGKEQLFRAIYEHYYKPERFEPFHKLIGDPSSAMKAFVDSIIGYRFEEPELMSITFQELSMYSNRSDTIKVFLFPIWELLKQILEEGKKLSVFQFESIDYAMTGIMGMVLFPPQTMVVEPFLEKAINREAMTKYITLNIFQMLGAPQCLVEER